MIESTENIGALQSKFTDVELFNLLTKPHKTPHEKLLIDVEVAVRNLENATTDTHFELLCKICNNINERVNLEYEKCKLLPRNSTNYYIEEEEYEEVETKLRCLITKVKRLKDMLFGNVNKKVAIDEFTDMISEVDFVEEIMAERRNKK